MKEKVAVRYPFFLLCFALYQYLASYVRTYIKSKASLQFDVKETSAFSAEESRKKKMEYEWTDQLATNDTLYSVFLWIPPAALYILK